MNVSSSTNSYQNINAYQQQNTHAKPVEPEQPIAPTTEYSASEVYKASNGNAIADKDGNLSLTPQGELNVSNAQQAKTDEAAAEVQAKKDDVRGTVVDYAAYQSKKSQVEIYLAVATDSKVEVGSDSTPSILENLRQTQKENNIVQAYAQYQENQQGAVVLF